MALRKTQKADLRRLYALYVEIGMILTLALLIVAFRVDLRTNSDFQVDLADQELVQMEDIVQTQQQEEPPPPPKPPVPVEVPNDEILEDDVLDLDMSLDIDEAGELPPPPPPPDDEPEPEPDIFVIVEEAPELLGRNCDGHLDCLRELQENMDYPEMARRAGVEGMVVVQFIVNEQGIVQEPVVLRDPGAGLGQEALKAIQQARFSPGRQRAKPVKVRMTLPIRFNLK